MFTNAKWNLSCLENLKKWTFGNIEDHKKIETSPFFFSHLSYFHLPTPGLLTPKRAKRYLFKAVHGTLPKYLVDISVENEAVSEKGEMEHNDRGRGH